jgi:dTDP-4-amino-4,6-dideoxygalactose transaminase
MTAKVPFIDLGRQYAKLRDDIHACVDKVMSSGQHIMGPELEAFESEVAAFCGSKHAIGVANGSDALWLSMKALDIGPGDEVITAPNSFIASAWSIVAAGATPRFSDVDETFNLDPEKLAQAITPRTRAIMPVHLTGRVADMAPILDIAARRGLHVIEDAAQAIGAERNGKAAGSFGIAAGFSLHPLKNLAAYGDGGLIVTSDDALAGKLRLLRNHGLKSRDESTLWGFNSRLDPLQAAILRIKLRHLKAWNESNRAMAERYHQALRSLVTVPDCGPDELPIYHRYVIQTDRRDELQTFLADRGIDTKVNYPIPIHLQPVAAELGYKKGAFPVAEQLAQRILSLPLYPELEYDEQTRVIDGITAFYSR